MYLNLLGTLAVSGFLLLMPAAADAACCQQGHTNHQAPPAGKQCCADHRHATEPTLVEQFMERDPQWDPAPPVRQLAEVWFHRPVLVGRSILQGHYVIEHDNDRLARGEPCTHIYAFNDRTKPVVAFHCTHLERARANQNTVALATAPDGLMKVLTEFQFAGETAAHGYPSVK
jgi:hypothetical protein